MVLATAKCAGLDLCHVCTGHGFFAEFGAPSRIVATTKTLDIAAGVKPSCANPVHLVPRLPIVQIGARAM
jgi:hypothetical protein